MDTSRTMTRLSFTRSFVTVFTVLLLLVAGTVHAEFGVSKQQTQNVEADGSQTEVGSQGAASGALSEQDAVDIAELVEQAKQDAETMHLVAQLKSGASGELEALRQLPMEDIVGGLKQTVDDLKVLDYLFQDGARALEEMNRAGMIEEQHLEKYRKDPTQLEEDTRHALYFQFVSLAVVAGLIE